MLMKFKNIYKVAGLIGLYIFLQSRAGGPASEASLQVTGAPGNGTCANTGCHTAGSFNPTVSMSLFDGANLAIKYDPGKTYTLRITISAISGSPARYGFQAVALDASNAQAGDWGTPPAGIGVKTLGGKKYIEHNAPTTASLIELPWVAPAAGTGSVTFYAGGLAANNNSNVTGDGNANGSLVITENGTSNADAPSEQFAQVTVMPNPVADMLNLNITSRLAGNHKVRIFSANGNLVKTQGVNLQAGQNTEQVPVGELAPGLYLVQICGDGHMAAVQMLKR